MSAVETRAPEGADESPAVHRWRPSLAVLRDVTIGTVLVGVGAAGLVLPVLPGWVLIFAGLILIAGHVPPLRQLVSRAVASRLARTCLAAFAERPRARRAAARFLALPTVRRAIERSSRWRAIRQLLPGSEGADPTLDRMEDQR